MKRRFEFDIALSFAGENRSYVEKVAFTLKQMGFKVFYDKYDLVTLWGKDLYVHLHEIYFKRARYTVIFISKHYAKKLWTNHERKSAQARAFLERREYILPVRFDKTKIPGILPTTGYIELAKLKPSVLAKIIKQKVGRIERVEFFPKKLDRLYSCLGVRTEKSKYKIFRLVESFYDTLVLMTIRERRILALAIANACPSGIPNNAHLNIEYFSRITSLSREEIISLFSRLDCLGIESKVYKYKKTYHKEKGVIKNKGEAIKIRYNSLLVGAEPNTTYIMLAIFECITEITCPNCTIKAFENVDFSGLSKLAGFRE